MNIEQQVWNYFLNKGFSPQGIAGLMGNIFKESQFKTNNLQDSYNSSFGISDEAYTANVDNGRYQNFPDDGAGYGLVQWTYGPFKQDLLNLCKSRHKSISDLSCQLDQIYFHLQSEGLLTTIKNATSTATATEYFMKKFEKPKDQSYLAVQERIGYAEKYYQQFNNKGGNSKMKYSKNNPPIVCMQTNSTCYQNTNEMAVRGVLWHSTGANNPNIKRYVQPSEYDSNYNQMIALIGKNPNGNDWNHISVQAGLNAWIGKLADGSVATVQTMPWNYKPWGCGSGSKGSCNNGWIQFEICEDSLMDGNYFNKIYQEACELTAYLCKLYNLNPLGNFNGIPTILCHQDSYQLGYGSNHSDVYHWFNRYGKNMDNVRKDVAAIMNNGSSSNITPTPTPAPTPSSNDNNFSPLIGLLRRNSVGEKVKELQSFLTQLGYSVGAAGIDGYFGNDTVNAVIQFQRDYGLDVDGIVGRDTWITLQKMLKIKKPEDNKQKEEVKPVPSVTPKYSGVVIGSASKDENGQYTNGQAGDQTGKEVWTLNWYNQNWTSVLRPTDANLAEKIAVACEKACANNNIGYSQSTRNSLLAQAKKVGLDISKITTPCNCDCSSLVSTCCVCAGLPEGTFFPYGNGCTTWTIADACLSTKKFTQLTDTKYRVQKDYLKRGDILLNKNQHVVIVLSDGNLAEQSIAPTPSSNTTFPYLVRIIVDVLNVRQEPNNTSRITAQVKRNQVYTIVAEEGGYGKLKSGVGYIDLQYTEKR